MRGFFFSLVSLSNPRQNHQINHCHHDSAPKLSIVAHCLPPRVQTPQAQIEGIHTWDVSFLPRSPTTAGSHNSPFQLNSLTALQTSFVTSPVFVPAAPFILCVLPSPTTLTVLFLLEGSTLISTGMHSLIPNIRSNLPLFCTST